MIYILVIIAGLLAASMINLYCWQRPKEIKRLTWYSGFFYREIKYIAIELVMTSIFVMLYMEYGLSVKLLAYALLSSILTAAAVKDLQSKLIPDELVLIGAAMGVLLIMPNPDITITGALLGCTVAGGVLALTAFATKGSLGFGDAKLFACIGLYLGLDRVIASMLTAAVLCGIFSIILLIKSLENRKREIAFAPFILVGTMLTLLL